MTSALEKAARALANADAKNGATGDALYANNPDMYQRLARAVLMAVRSDEEGVNRAWMECTADFDTGPEETFTAMIDAILSEEQE